MNTKLYIGNLPSATTQIDLRAKFEIFGTVRSAIVITDGDTGRSKRFGFVEMASEAGAGAAVSRLNMTQYEEAIISVREARAGE